MTENRGKFDIDWSAIRDEIDLQTVIKDHGGIIQRGKFLCPAHNDKNPSAYLLPKRKKQRWVCYSCGEGGSCIDYIVFSMGLTKDEAALYLGQTYGVGLSEWVKDQPSIASMLSKTILKELGLTRNPFFSVKERVNIPPESMGTEWELSSIPENGYDKDMGPMKLDESEAMELLRGKCMEYLATHTRQTQERRLIEHLYAETAKHIKTTTRETEDYELGA